MSLREKLREFDFQVRFRFLSRIFPKHKASRLYFAMIHEIPRQAGQQVRPKPKSSGLEVQVNVDFQDKKFYSQCSNTSKQGIILQANYRGLL